MKVKNKKFIFLLPLLIIVLLNYLIQIPYDIHLYHGRFNPLGVMLLLVTLIWFITGFVTFVNNIKVGYWILFTFLLIQFIFYFENEIILSFFGYGIIWHLFHVNDVIRWTAFFIGDLNFLIASYYLYYLQKKRKFFV